MKSNSVLVGAFATLCTMAGGCAHWPATPPLEHAGAPGYRLAEVGSAAAPGAGIPGAAERPATRAVTADESAKAETKEGALRRLLFS
jgi:hypothetical protein